MMADQAIPPSYISPPGPQAGPDLQPYTGSNVTNPHMVTMQTAQAVPMFTYAQTASTPNTNYKSNQSKGLGIMQIIVGLVCIVINAVGIAFASQLSFAAIGIWGGIMFIITGSFGVSAAKARTKCKIITFMVLSIISAGITVPLFICSVIGAILDTSHYYCYYSYNYYYYSYSSSYSCQEKANVAIAMNALLACLAIGEAIAAIWGSAICCKSGCCCNNSGNQQLMIPVQYATIQGQPVIIIPQPQMNFGGQTQMNFGGQMVTCAPPEYSSQQTVTVPAPPYPTTYWQDSASSMVHQPTYSTNESMEKQPL